jgi:transcriptional regulator with XRE-family HTH domain
MTSPHTRKLRQLRRIIGNNIRNQRLKRNMTLAKLSRLTNYSMNRLDMFEMGKDEIELHYLSRLSIALNCDISILFSGVGETP